MGNDYAYLLKSTVITGNLCETSSELMGLNE